MNKSVTITSNDPENPIATISVKANIELDFDFETPNFYMGRIAKGEKVNKTVYIRFKSTDKVNILGITSSSPYISAREAPATDSPAENPDRIPIEVTVELGMPAGSFNESITVRSDHPRHPEARLMVSGTIPGDVEITPRSLNFLIAGPAGSSNERTDSLMIVNNLPAKQLEILGVRDAGDRLKLDLVTEEPGRKFKLRVRLLDKGIPKEGQLNGSIVVTTNNAEFKEITIPYSAVWRQ